MAAEPVSRTMRRAQVRLAIHRYQNCVYYRRIDHEAFLLLSALQKGATLGAALDTAFCESALSAEEQATKIQEYFSHAAELGWFCKQQDNEASRCYSSRSISVEVEPR